MTIRSFQWIAAIMLVAILPVQSLARGYYRSGDVTVEIVSDQRGTLRKFAARSARADTDRHYVIARNGEDYRIRISNPSNERVGVVIGVDGRNIISGRRSHLKSDERMFILEPYQTEEYGGWQKGRNRIRRFSFDKFSDSYGPGWDNSAAMGVVKVAVFRERHHQSYGKKQGKEWRGRKHGNRGRHFVAQKRPVERKVIRYEHRSTLCRKGVVQCRPRHEQRPSWPHPRKNVGYAPSPSWSFHLRF